MFKLWHKLNKKRKIFLSLAAILVVVIGITVPLSVAHAQSEAAAAPVVLADFVPASYIPSYYTGVADKFTSFEEFKDFLKNDALLNGQLSKYNEKFFKNSVLVMVDVREQVAGRIVSLNSYTIDSRNIITVILNKDAGEAPYSGVKTYTVCFAIPQDIAGMKGVTFV